MLRRDFLRLTAAASLAPRPLLGDGATAPTTVLYDDRVTALADMRSDSADATRLWVRKRDLPRINDFELKPQGACRADICIPVAKTMVRGDYFDLTAFARKVGESVVAEPGEHVWSLGEIQTLRGAFLKSRIAPDFTVPDRLTRPVRLSAFRGRKVLVITWASW